MRVRDINRENKKTVYSFQTLTLPYFSKLHSEWYHYINNKRFKKFKISYYKNYIVPKVLF